MWSTNAQMPPVYWQTHTLACIPCINQTNTRMDRRNQMYYHPALCLVITDITKKNPDGLEKITYICLWNYYS